jgi:hypothetical protein
MTPRRRGHTTLEATRQTKKTHWTSWKRLGTWPYYTRQGISSPCDATTPEGFGPETSRWATWCFGYDKTPEGAISSRLPRKGRSSSQDSEARNIRAGQQSRRGLQQRLEHPTATSLLPLICFQVVHVPHLRTQAKSNHKGRVSLALAKPEPPSGARRGNPLCIKISLGKSLSARTSFVLFDYFDSGILKTMEYT